MNINLQGNRPPGDLQDEFDFNKRMIEQVIGEDHIAGTAPLLIPQPDSDGTLAYQVWWPTVWHTLVWVSPEGVLITQEKGVEASRA